MTNPSPLVNDALLDRLVDGELTADERRELLATLERSPDGWRRCALAFVESQTLGECLGGLLTETNAAAPRPPSQPVSAPIKSMPRTAPGWSIAAAVLLAFGLGLAVRGLPSTSSPAPTIATNDRQRLDPQPADPQPADPRRADAQAKRPLNESLVVWAADGRGAGQAIRAPLVDADAIHQRFGVRLDAAPSPEVLEEFERRGFQLSTRRRFAPLYVGGRGGVQSIVVPVDDVRVAPIRNVSL